MASPFLTLVEKLREGQSSGDIKSPKGPGMSVEDILTFAPSEPDIRNAQHVSFKSLKNIGSPTHPVIKGETVTAEPGDKPRLHRQLVRPKDPSYEGKLSACPAILIDCDCERFMFMWEWALNYHGAAEIFRCNGEPPMVTNPELIPGCCKHHFIILHTIKKAKV